MSDPAFELAHELLDEEPFEETFEEGRAWRAPDGGLIVKTLEANTGTCGVLTYAYPPSFDHDFGGTDWGDGESVRRAGQLVFLDEAGDEWLECEILKDPTVPLPDAVESVWSKPEMVRKHFLQIITEFFVLTTGTDKLDVGERADLAAVTTEITHLAMKVRNRKAKTK